MIIKLISYLQDIKPILSIEFVCISPPPGLLRAVCAVLSSAGSMHGRREAKDLLRVTKAVKP